MSDNRRSDNVERTIKSVNISQELLKDVKELKREGITINLSKAAEKGIKEEVDKYKDDNLAFYLKKQRRKAKELIEKEKEKIKQIEEQANKKLNSNLDEYIENNDNAGRSRWDKKVEKWAKQYWDLDRTDERFINNLDEKNIKNEAINIFNLKIEEYGITGHDRIKFHDDAIEYIKGDLI